MTDGCNYIFIYGADDVLKLKYLSDIIYIEFDSPLKILKLLDVASKIRIFIWKPIRIEVIGTLVSPALSKSVHP